MDAAGGVPWSQIGGAGTFPPPLLARAVPRGPVRKGVRGGGARAEPKGWGRQTGAALPAFRVGGGPAASRPCGCRGARRLRQAQARAALAPPVRPWPAWLVFILFVPLQVYLAILLFREWPWWGTALFLLGLGIVTSRASRVPILMAIFMPNRAFRRERRRHVYQGILFLGGAVLLLLHYAGLATYGPLAHWLGPERGVPLLGVMMLVSLVKSAVR